MSVTIWSFHYIEPDANIFIYYDEANQWMRAETLHKPYFLVVIDKHHERTHRFEESVRLKLTEEEFHARFKSCNTHYYELRSEYQPEMERRLHVKLKRTVFVFRGAEMEKINDNCY